MAQVDEVHNVLASHFGTGWSDITNNMPSIRSLFAFGLSALTNVQSVFGLHNAVTRQFSQDLSASATCTSPQLSCHNTSAVADLCCVNSPGGELLQTQFWGYCAGNRAVRFVDDPWAMGGWNSPGGFASLLTPVQPDNCDGTYDSSCDPSRAYTNITQILQAAGANDLVSYMQTYWVSNSGTPESFWEH
ncbi:Ribonuclease T2 precursor (RNase T2), partial [Friedmanniomyces endolithicus]